MEMMLWQSAFISQVKNTLKQRLTDSFLRLTSLCDFISLEGLKEELEKLKDQDVIASILGKKSELNDYARDVGVKLQQVEVESIKDYMKESDNLISLHTQIRDCDSILEEMEGLLGGFQANLGVISSELKGLQEQSMSMGHKLKNRKIAESDLSRFLENIVVPPKMIDIIANSEINEEYVKTLQTLSKKLHFLAKDPVARISAAYKDVEPEVEKLRVKALCKARDFLIQKFGALREPKTNIQILQQNVFLKYKYLALFLNEHAKEVYSEVFMAYIDTLKKVLIVKFRTYIQSLEKMQLDIVTVNDLIGVQDTKRLQLFSRSKEPLKNRSSVFSLGNRDKILKELEQPALIAHIVEAKGEKYPYEVLFRSLHKLLMDTATSEYLFCHSFFGDDAIFLEIFAGPFGVIDEHLNSVLPNNYDAIGLMLMIRITHQHQLIMSRRRIPCLDPYLDKVNLMLWPRFKMVFDLHLSSIRSANIWALWENDVHAHYVMRRYAEFTTSLLQLNVEYGDGQLDSNLDRLRLSVDDLLIKIARCFKHQKQQTIFLINNYDMVLSVFKEAGIRESRTQQQFEELLKSSQTVFLEAILLEHFPQLIMFVKTRTGDNTASSSRQPIKVEEVEPLIKGFAERWKRDFGLIHEEIITSFSNLLCGMEILRLTLTQFLLYYSRFSDVVRQIDVGDVLKVKLVSVNSIMYEMKNYSRTF